MLNNLHQIHLKLPQKEEFKKHLKQLVICLAIKLLIELRTRQGTQQEITQIKNIGFDREISNERYLSPEQ